MSHSPVKALTYNQACTYLLENHGVSVGYATLRRWHARGCKASGGVRLEGERVGGRWFTRAEWINAFIQACNPSTPESPPTNPQLLSPADLKGAEQARRYLAERGCLGAKAKADALGLPEPKHRGRRAGLQREP